jgi:hypothetical protein
MIWGPRAGQDSSGLLICHTIVLSVRGLFAWHERDRRDLGDYDWLAEQWLAKHAARQGNQTAKAR